MFKSHCNAHPQRLDLFEMGELLERSRSENEAIIRAKCQTSYLGAHVALCRVLGRFKMFVDTNDIDLSTHLMLDGYWEMWVTEAMCRLVRPGMVVADIGANLGYFALLMAELVGPDGFVHAFEPNPHIARQLRQSLDINSFSGRHAVHQVALAAIDGEPMAFVVPPTENSIATTGARIGRMKLTNALGLGAWEGGRAGATARREDPGGPAGTTGCASAVAGPPGDARRADAPKQTTAVYRRIARVIEFLQEVREGYGGMGRQRASSYCARP